MSSCSDASGASRSRPNWPVRKIQPSLSTAWLLGETEGGNPARIWRVGRVIAPPREGPRRAPGRGRRFAATPAEIGVEAVEIEIDDRGGEERQRLTQRQPAD